MNFGDAGFGRFLEERFLVIRAAAEERGGALPEHVPGKCPEAVRPAQASRWRMDPGRWTFHAWKHSGIKVTGAKRFAIAQGNTNKMTDPPLPWMFKITACGKAVR